MIVSIIVPIYNAEKYIHRCIDSILNQTYKELEVILVDDGSKDSSGAIIDAYSELDFRVKVIHKPNGGVSSARNIGLDNATGEFVAFVDADDYLAPNAYEKMMEANSEGVQVISGFKIGESIVSYKSGVVDLYKAIKILNETRGSNCGYIWHRLFERKLIGNLRFNTHLSFGEDGVFWFDYVAKNPALMFLFIKDITYNYYKGDNTESLTKKYISPDLYNLLISEITRSFKKYVRIYENPKLSTYLTVYIKQRYIRFISRSISETNSILQQTDFERWKMLAKNNVLFMRKIRGYTMLNYICKHLLIDECKKYMLLLRIYNLINRNLSKIGIII